MPEPSAPAPLVFIREAADPSRLDRFLTARLPEYSRTRLQALIHAGAVQVDAAVAQRPSALLDAGVRVELVLAPPSPSLLEPEAIPLDVLYEDDDLVALNKPAGLIVHPSAGQRAGTLVNALLHRYANLSTHGGAARPGIVHRLDRCTSGVMVVARNDFAHQRLAEQFQARAVQKVYIALVQGVMASPRGDVDLPIRRDLNHRIRMTTRRRADAQSREAHTSYTVQEAFLPPAATPAGLRSAYSYSLLEVCIHTGRTHQIRVHMSALGRPVVGDRLYGAATALAGPGALAGLRPPRVMLHAATLRLSHPRSGAPLCWQAPLPVDMVDLLALLRAESHASAPRL